VEISWEKMANGRSSKDKISKAAPRKRASKEKDRDYKEENDSERLHLKKPKILAREGIWSFKVELKLG